jgi:hypothetical protein
MRYASSDAVAVLIMGVARILLLLLSSSFLIPLWL